MKRNPILHYSVDNFQNERGIWQRYSSEEQMSGKLKVPSDKRSLDYVADLPNRHKRRANILP